MNIDQSTKMLLEALVKSVQYHVAHKNVDEANGVLDMLLGVIREGAEENSNDR